MGLKLGQRVKLNFTKVSGPVEAPRDVATGQEMPWSFGGEMMWVIITGPKNSKTGKYTGRLLNKPMVVDYKCNQKVYFLESEVLEVRGPTLKAKLVYNFIDWCVPSWSR